MKTSWNLALLYKGHDDPQIEKDVKAVESAYSKFERKYRGKDGYLRNEAELFAALKDYESLFSNLATAKPLYYYQYALDLDCNDSVARARSTQLLERFQKNDSKTIFFELSLAKIPAAIQKRFLRSNKLAPYRYFLKVIFDQARFNLSEPEEKILGLMAIPAYQQWLNATEKQLNQISISVGDRKLPISEVMMRMPNFTLEERRDAHDKAMRELERISDIAESEMNAIAVRKKISDELRGYKDASESTILGNQNQQKSIDALVKAVNDNVRISHRYYALKAKLIGLPYLEYPDRGVEIGGAEMPLSFGQAAIAVKSAFAEVDKRYEKLLDDYLKTGQIDVYPKSGKTAGAYCSGAINMPTFILLNHPDSFEGMLTLAHEMGHAIHLEMSKSQLPLYQYHTMSTGEVASTFFEAVVFESMFDSLSDEEKIQALHKRINDDVQSIFRQIACFNFETEFHRAVREKGEVSKKEICEIMNRNMQAYLGPAVKLKESDGYFFVYWSHIRRFFYVYSYAFGQLVSKALYAEYKKDKKFIDKINKFLSAGGSDSPENIFKSIGIDVTKPDFWIKGLKSIEKDIETLEKLTKNQAA